MKGHLLAVVIGFSLVLSGCTLGTNFKRPEPGALVTGRSTSADVVRVMGTPYATSDDIKNGEKFQTLYYIYAKQFGDTRYPKVLADRLMRAYIFNDLLVGQEFVSTFSADTTDYDASKIGLVHKGKTTRAEVLSLLGQPNGEVNYPIIKNRSERGIIYSYMHSSFKSRISPSVSRVLVVTFDASDVVTDLDFTLTEIQAK